jgi:hypothetical protein
MLLIQRQFAMSFSIHFVKDETELISHVIYTAYAIVPRALTSGGAGVSGARGQMSYLSPPSLAATTFF